MKKLIESVTSLREKQVSLTRELISIPTVNPYSGDPSPASEGAGQDWIEARMRELGAETRRIPVPADVYTHAGILGPRSRSWEGRENVVGEWIFGDGLGSTILLNSHMDTVGVADWECDPFDARVENGTIRGRGTSDSKGNLVLGLIAVEALRRAGGTLRGRLRFESVVDEECDGGGAGTLACCRAGITGDAAVVIDGAAGAPYFGSNGVVTPRITIRAQAGHSAFVGGTRALDLAIAVKSVFDDFAREHQTRHPACHANIGVFRAGTHASVVPGKAEIIANVSYPFEEAVRAEKETGVFDGRRVRKQIEGVVARQASAGGGREDASVRLEWIKDLYPYRCHPGNPLFRLAREAIETAGGQRIEPGILSAWGDATHLANQLGIPTVGMGFGTPGQAHGNNEQAALSDLFHGAASVAILLQRLFDPGERMAQIG